MEKQRRRAMSAEYWDRNAKWYQLWLEHNAYHRRALEVLGAFVRPGWAVLDIGAGSGVLSLPLAAMGCTVTALEPSACMRALLEKEGTRRRVSSLLIDTRTWEDVPLSELGIFDLIVASNSLHLTESGFASALDKVFRARPHHVFIVSEKQFLDCFPDDRYGAYTRRFEEQWSTDSSYAYHCLEDAIEHWSFRHERIPEPYEEHGIVATLSYEDGHFWSKGIAHLCMYWWSRCEGMNSSEIMEEGKYACRNVNVHLSADRLGGLYVR